ncbi:hypothetical protein GCK72_021614 [Caenorhabditis remanei]|uniref:CRE-CEH-51 protein n=1 Tax=Caenorhabditis remanei TaxID=31234 RepID=E3N0I5_CAERE|nr:hypothetical protein GCK72_021614 [Caenorhabditis remanei]EFP13374.1 CRE-CEH-51 protein [Caenorhabditis remanei]KAF1755046.1 hypothetical protein GCK72_021614 [Caenorhabditis remanei]
MMFPYPSGEYYGNPTVSSTSPAVSPSYPHPDMSMCTPMPSPFFPQPNQPAPGQVSPGGYQRPGGHSQAVQQYLQKQMEESARIAQAQAAYFTWIQPFHYQQAHFPHQHPGAPNSQQMLYQHPNAMTPQDIQQAFDVAGDKYKRGRIPFTQEQVKMMEARFSKSDKILIDERRTLARAIGLTPNQIKIWFQNRRFKLRKAEKEKERLETELMDKTGKLTIMKNDEAEEDDFQENDESKDSFD